MLFDAYSQTFLKTCQQPTSVSFPDRKHINILIPSMVLGGAERIVHDTLRRLERSEITTNLLLLFDQEPTYPIKNLKNVQVIIIQASNRQHKLRTIIMEILSSPTPIVYTHLIRANDLTYLWGEGIVTIPVIHNSQEGWLDEPHHYNHKQVPFVVACCDAVAQQVRYAGCTKPVITIRHEIHRREKYEDFQSNRLAIRNKFKISDADTLIGMVGQFKPQKAYSRALEILSKVRQYVPVKLMILGGWDTVNNHAEYIKVIEKAKELDVIDDLVLVGNVYPVTPFYHAFDLYLNCSDYEGLSIATIESQQHSCPIVTADVGGQKEILLDAGGLIKDISDINSYVEAIRRVSSQPRQLEILPSKTASLIPMIWYLLSKYGAIQPEIKGTLFVSNNLNLAGAQRSLTNLICHPNFNHETFLCLIGESFENPHFARLEKSNIPVFTLFPEKDILKRVELFLELLSQIKVESICFWNVEPRFKLLVSKILSAAPIKIIDVSPGSMYFDEMKTTFEFQRRIAWDMEQYFSRLNHFIAKYKAGIIPQTFDQTKTKSHIIPNGVYMPTDEDFLTDCKMPTHINYDFAIGTCCRISPVKRIEWLIDMIYILTTKIPEVSLTIVGGVHLQEVDYWDKLIHILDSGRLKNIFFPGPTGNVFPYLSKFKLFVMVSEPGGCPNASLEAMSLGVPVVATRFGGAIDQIENGINGFLVSPEDPQDMANKVEFLLTHPLRMKEMGQAALKKVGHDFSMESMVSRYLKILNES